MPEVGMEGQLKLKNARVLLVGVGGLGSPLAMYLAAAGVGTIGIVDFDVVDITNLHRQVIHGSSDVGRSKLESASEVMEQINPHIQVNKHQLQLSSANALEVIGQYDIVVDGTDNFPTRYLVNDACVMLKKPNVYGSIFRFDGQATIFATQNGPCYRCLYPEPPPPGLVPSCAEGGVLGILPGTIGLIQATETVKFILGIGETLVGRLLLYDALSMNFREFKIQRDPECVVCGINPSVLELVDYESLCGIRATIESYESISVQELKDMFVQDLKYVFVDVREPHEYEINRITGSKLIPLGELTSRLGRTHKRIQNYCALPIRRSECEGLHPIARSRV